MPLFIIERNFAEQLELSNDDVKLIEEINTDEGVRWLFSFLSADRRRTYCLYEAPSADAIRAAARRGSMPADAIVEVREGTEMAVPQRLQDWAATQRQARQCADKQAREGENDEIREEAHSPFEDTEANP